MFISEQKFIEKYFIFIFKKNIEHCFWNSPKMTLAAKFAKLQSINWMLFIWQRIKIGKFFTYIQQYVRIIIGIAYDWTNVDSMLRLNTPLIW